MNQPETPPVPEKSKAAKIFVFAVISVIFLFVLTITGLIYFKIVPIKISSKPSPSPLVSINKKPFRKLILDFLPQILNAKYLPREMDINLTPVTETDFAFVWNIKENQFSGTLASSDQKSISSLFLSSWQEQSASASGELTLKTAASTITVKPQGDWKCKTKYGMRFCESFWQDADGTKKGVGLQSPVYSQANKKGFVTIFCEFNNTAFDKWKSCFNEFAEKGF